MKMRIPIIKPTGLVFSSISSGVVLLLRISSCPDVELLDEEL